MNWTEQAQEMMRSWTETQKKLWEGWSGAASQAAPGGNGLWTNWLSQWHQMARQNLRRLTAGVESVPKEVSERMFFGETLFLRFVDLALGAFKTIAPKIDAGEDWVELIRRYMAQMKAEMSRPSATWATPEAAAAAARDLPELWKLYVGQVKDLGLPWARSLREARGHLGDAMSGDRQASIKMYNLFMDTCENTLGKFVAAPAIGYTREFQEKVTKAFDTWVDVRRAEVEFQTEIMNAGFRTVEAMVRELVEKGERGERITSFRELFDLWVATAERAYFEVASTESFAETQARLVNAAMHYRVHEREVAEEFLRAMHLPTRRELDDAYRHMHDLRSEIKFLRRELSQLSSEVKSAQEKQAQEAPARGTRVSRTKTPTTRARSTRAAKSSTGTARTRRATKKEG